MRKSLFDYKVVKYKKGMATLLDEAMPPEQVIRIMSARLDYLAPFVAWTQTFDDYTLDNHTDKSVMKMCRYKLRNYMKTRKTGLSCVIYWELTPDKLRLHFHAIVKGEILSTVKGFCQTLKQMGHQLLKPIDNLEAWVAYCDKSCDNGKPIFEQRRTLTMGADTMVFDMEYREVSEQPPEDTAEVLEEDGPSNDTDS